MKLRSGFDSRRVSPLCALLVLAALGCGHSPQSSAPSAPQVAGLIAVPYVRPPGLPPQVLPPAPVTSIALVVPQGQGLAPVGSTTRLTVNVTDAFGAPVAGAYVSFVATDPRKGPYGLGTTTSDASGAASVAAIPATRGPARVTVTASTTYAPAVTATLDVVGQ